MASTDIKDYWRRSWGLGDRVGFKDNPLKNFDGNIYKGRDGQLISNVKNEKLGFIYPHKTKKSEIKWSQTHSERKGKYDITKDPPIKKLKGNKRYKFDIDKDRWVYKSRIVGEPALIQKEGETFKQFNERKEKTGLTKMEEGRIKLIESKINTRNIIDNWATTWLDKNLSKYKVRNSETYLNDLKKDYKAFVKKNYPSGKIGVIDLFSPDGLPNLSRSSTKAPFQYEGFKTVNLGEYGGSTTVNPTRNQPNTSFFRKIFYKNKIRTDPKLLNNINKYFTFINTNKRFIEGRELMRNFKPDSDVLYLLDPKRSKLDSAPKGEIFSSFDENFHKSYKNYQYRIVAGELWKRNSKIIENTLGKKEIKRLTGSDTIEGAMRKERAALKKIFDYTKLPKDLKLSYAMDHGQGIAAAAKSGDKNLMRLALTDLIGSTVKTNEVLGRGEGKGLSFERQRVKLIGDISKGDTSKLKELNEITEKAYGKKNVYKIVNGELISSRISSAKDAEGRYKQYIEKIAKIPVAKKEIIKQSKTSPELEKIFKDIGIKLTPNLKSKAKTFLRNAFNKGQDISSFMPKVTRGGVAVLDYALFHHLFGVPGTEALIGASGWLTKKPQLGKSIVTTAMMAGMQEEGKEKEKEKEVDRKPLVWKQGILEVADNMARGGLSGVDQYMLNRYK